MPNPIGNVDSITLPNGDNYTVGKVTGVKGNAENAYRSGDVNITPANVGALDVDNVYNGLDKTAAGYALDARQGKALADKLDATQSDIAIIIEGNQTTHTGGAAVGEYVIVRNSTISGIADGLYKAVQAIPANTAIDSTYLAAVDGGGLNELNSKIEAEISLPSGYSASGNNKVYKVGKVVQFSVALTIPAWTTKTLSIKGLIPSGFTPGIETNFAGIDNTNDIAISCFITSGGNLSIYRSYTTNCISLRLCVTYLT